MTSSLTISDVTQVNVIGMNSMGLSLDTVIPGLSALLVAPALTWALRFPVAPNPGRFSRGFYPGRFSRGFHPGPTGRGVPFHGHLVHEPPAHEARQQTARMR